MRILALHTLAGDNLVRVVRVDHFFAQGGGTYVQSGGAGFTVRESVKDIAEMLSD